MPLLTPNELSLIGCIREYGPITLDALARFAYRTKEEMARQLLELKKKNLITERENGEYSVDFYYIRQR